MRKHFYPRVLLTLLCLGFLLPSFAQVRTITGTVKDEKGGPLAGATIRSVETPSTITTSDARGNFTLRITEKDKKIEVSYVGLDPETIPIRSESNYDVTLKGGQSMNDVIVVGYGTMRRRDVTGAVTSIKGADISKAAPTDMVSALQGRAAGVVVSTNDGAPGAGLAIQVRGTNSFLSGTSPLYVIDGIPYGTSNSGNTPSSDGGNSKQSINSLGFLNPSDIESIEILKDASATAIYGSRGANGVILITTKKGKRGMDKVELNSNMSVNSVIKKIDVLDAHEYALMQNEAYRNANYYDGTSMDIPYDGSMKFDVRSGKYFKSKTPEEYIGHNNDWQDILFRNALTQNHTLTISGGGDAGNHLLSFNYVNQQGVIVGSKYQRYGIRANLNRNLKNWLVVGTNLVYGQEINNMVKTNTTDNAHAEGVTRSALTYNPTQGLYDTLSAGFSQSDLITNPYIYATTLKDEVKAITFNSSTYLEATLLKGLRFRQNFGYNIYNARRENYIPRTVHEGRDKNGIAFVASNEWNSLVLESIMSYLGSVGDHTFNATAGFVYEKSNFQYVNNRATNFINDLLQNYNLKAAQNPDPPVTGRGAQALASVLGRLNYNYKNRYLVTVSWRADGSSKFARNNKWAYFPSAALGWNLKQEPFMKQFGFISEFKFRLGYGKTGNQAIGPYQSLDRLAPYNYSFNGALSSGFAEDVNAGPGNDDLRWEPTEQYNAGIDAAFLNNRITFTADFYHKETTDLLQFLTIPGSNGFTRKLVNSGSVRNKGFEFAINTIPVSNSLFSWSIGGNISFNRNKILSLGDDSKEQFAASLDYRAQNAPFIQRVGLPIGALYSWVEDGIYRNEAEVRADPVKAGLTDPFIRKNIGEIRYVDLNKDGIIDDKDRTIIGDVNPKFTYGITTNFNYKRFDLNIFVNGRQGGNIVNMNYRLFNDVGSYNNVTQEAWDNRWTPENWEHATYPKAWKTEGRPMYITKRFLEDGSFIRLRNVVLGYNVPLSSTRILERLRIYISGTNLLTISNYKGFDPDINGFGEDPALRGVDLSAYPNSKTFNFGIQASF
ncbi:SusC/RagA family TonB-linked outer membrane protein [Pseudobacter ginsenosidimutans]|uniref:TonB-linked SusC/RagA family outer membrane protein n=1 Tax=Pseudobacter ginsenosidimutans TaxID=661488 RepID=A0A4Q7N4B6_9BACT|nr:TonB-dependent receptor [Pseudobacter ginsenosidimutans]QEC44374.1 TonB-dependent receptor [Pseudobacter ginsenosidimutans]RZS75839.1 TonB-linked SusC/RagA family outer membrane protein [Pseudobacter ginsenosidimutans]